MKQLLLIVLILVLVFFIAKDQGYIQDFDSINTWLSDKLDWFLSIFGNTEPPVS
jgi:hypothetical protein